ncbi:uncharacterized protein LOC117302661 [Asterias rubens]|uniref:uncharacterized protein LOC117302661 n=1 Tax=Asterias rubens TaxID=7604 RepID=UPI0014551D29|nr:uncharacterized protein LOC117302661 [Asterias rubens]
MMVGGHFSGRGATSLIVLALVINHVPLSFAEVACYEQSIEFFSTPSVSMSLFLTDRQDITNSSVADCARLCRRSDGCLSFTYSKMSEFCSLHPHDSSTGLEFQHAAETDDLYYEMVDKHIDRTEYFGGCVKSKCQNGGSCKSDCSDEGFYCACAENYRGDRCQFAREDEPVLVQTLEGSPSQGSTGFTFNNEHFLIVGGYISSYNGSEIEATTRVFKFNESTAAYEYDQDLIGLSMAKQITPMVIGEKLFVFGANFQTFGGSRTVDSIVYIYSNGTFDSFQMMTTYGAWASTFLSSTAGPNYMFISNSRGDNYNMDSPIYKWYSEYDKFYHVQNVGTKGAGTPVLFEIAGVSYLVVPFSYGDSAGYNAQPELWKQSQTSYVYMGCFLDDGNRAMSADFYNPGTMDVETCVTYCRLRGHPYAGLQAGSQCFCGDENYDVYGLRSDGECSSNCNGNSNEQCGGSWRNSVYLTDHSWTLLHTLPDATATVAATHFHHAGSDYLVLTPETDGSSCDHDLVTYVWNGENEEFQTHQKIPETQCIVDVEVFKANGRMFLIIGASRTQHTVSSNDDYTVQNRIYIMEGSIFVLYWSIEGQATMDWSVFKRNGETYLTQANTRSANNGSDYGGAEFNIYQWY